MNELRDNFVVPPGIEPGTQGFSVLCSTNWAKVPLYLAVANIKRVFHNYQIKIEKSIVFLTSIIKLRMNLVIDIGNSKVKVAVFETDTMIMSIVCEESSFLDELKKISNNYQIVQSIVSSVKNIESEYFEELQKLPSLLLLNSDTPVPFKNLYSSPSTLGNDRIALAAAAVLKYPQKNSLVIDAGTCITYDFVNSNNEYLGGAISPGLEMRYKAWHQHTSKLPLLLKNEVYKRTGFSTTESIHSGVINGVICEIEGVIVQYKQDFHDLTVVLTGGDTKFLSKQLKNSIFANQNFLLQGLNKILTHNNQ